MTLPIHFNDGQTECIHSLAELNEEWEDASEEPKEYWAINPLSEKPKRIDGNGEFRVYGDEDIAKLEEIGFLYKTEEEAEQATERLKAWKRLKDKGFRFNNFYRLNEYSCDIVASFNENWSELYDDLALLFGDVE